MDAAVTIAKRRKRGRLRLVAGLAGVAELAIGCFVCIAALAPEGILSLALPCVVALGGIATLPWQRIIYRKAVKAGLSLTEFEAEQMKFQWISLATYLAICATTFLPWEAVRAVPVLWLGVSGTWEGIAYVARFRRLLHP